MKKFLLLLLSVLPLAATTYNSDGSVANINTLIAGCNPAGGDIVTIPGSSFTMGAGSTFINIIRPVTLQGAGTGSTVITVSSGTHSGGLFQIYASGVTIKDFAIIPAAGKTNFNINASGFHITNILYNEAAATVTAYFALINSGYGLINYCDVTAGGGNNELVFGQGPDDAWDTEYVGGSTDQVYIENNIFRFPGTTAGYVCDANSNAKFVVRMNYITGLMKIDGHGYNTNASPARGVRGMEIMGNYWSGTTGSNWAAVEVRGGVGYMINNVVKGSSSVLGYYRFRDYGVDAPGSNYGGVYQTPYDYPLLDGVGNGPGALGAQTGGGQPYYVVNNYKGGSAATMNWRAIATDVSRSTDAAGYSIGATNIAMTGGSVRTGNWLKFTGDSTYYEVTSGYTTTSGTVTITPALAVAIPASVTTSTYGAFTNYKGQTNNASATFTMGPNAPCIVENNRDYFINVSPFTGSSGGGSGTAAQMAAITPSADGVFFWVTDEGTWNSSFVGTVAATAIEQWDYCEIVSVGTTDFTLIGAPSNTVGVAFTAIGAGTGTGTVKPAQGRLYTAESGSWTLNYTPYSYPYSGNPPPTPPSFSSATVNSAGTQLTTNFSISCTTGAGGSGGMAVSASGGAVTLSYSSGSGSTAYVWGTNRTINAGEVLTLSYTQPGNGIESTSDQVDLASFSDFDVTNGSTVNNTQAAASRAAVVGGGF